MNAIQLQRCILRDNIVLSRGFGTWTFRADSINGSFAVTCVHDNGQAKLDHAPWPAAAAAEFITGLISDGYVLDAYTLRAVTRKSRKAV